MRRSLRSKTRLRPGDFPLRESTNRCGRILAAKARLGLDRAKLVDVAKLNETFGRPEFEAQAQEMADRGVTLLRDSARIVPLDATRPLRVLLVALSADPDACPGETIEPEIRTRVDSLAVLRADTRFRKCHRAEAASLRDDTTWRLRHFSCAWRIARATSDFPRISARL